jgi:hypothetical protein
MLTPSVNVVVEVLSGRVSIIVPSTCVWMRVPSILVSMITPDGFVFGTEREVGCAVGGVAFRGMREGALFDGHDVWERSAMGKDTVAIVL